MKVNSRTKRTHTLTSGAKDTGACYDAGVNLNIFRAYDIRGIYPTELNEKASRLIVLALVNLYPNSQKIVVARDPRISSPSLSKEIINTLIKSGKEVIDIGIAPDPLFYFSIFHYSFDGGIMISGSHNPKEYNGLTLNIQKPNKKTNEDIVGENLEKIKSLILSQKMEEPNKKGKITPFNPARSYIDYVTEKTNLKKSLKIIIDSGNGACGYLPERVFKKLGCQVKTLYGDFDGMFPHHLPDPYQKENVQEIKKTVLKEKADLGFAYDSDGDRVAIIDNQGRLVSGDDCLLMLARQSLRKKRGPVIHDMRVSKAFLDEMKKEGIKTYFSVSHHSAIINKIIETQAVFGGEITLHFLFPLDYYLCDDAVFASLKLAEIASEKDNFSSYVDSLPRYFVSPEVFLDSTDEEKFKIIKKLQDYLEKNKYDFVDIDGARINFEHGWALARAANTTPFIKCRFEGETKEHLIKIEKESLNIFKKAGISITKKTYQELGLQ